MGLDMTILLCRRARGFATGRPSSLLCMKTLPRALGIVLVALAGTAELAAQGSGAARAPVGSIAHTWKPIRDGGPEIVAIDVRTEVTELPASAGDGFSLKVPIVYANVTGIAERTLNLSVRDAAGEVPLTVEDDPPAPGGFPYYRHLRASRRVTFPLAYTYRSLSQTGQFRGPPFGLFSAAGGISGAGSGFLVLPEGDLVVTTRVHWDLSGLAAGATALTSFGDGDFTLRGEPSAPTQGWIMAGVLGGYSSPNGGAFSAAWTGTPAWDPAAEMRWASEMFTWLGKSYGYLNPLPRYRVFIRTGGTRGVGTALDNSFMMSAPPRDAGAPAQGEAPRETITHEMGHLFVGQVDAPQGVSSWFSEGLNTYYTRVLPMRGGFTSVEEYGRQVNTAFQEYWFGVARNFSADSITKIGFADEKVRHMPYVRSSLYFADLDAKIRAHSGGRRTLDEVLRELFERRARGERFNHEMWVATVTREAGPGAGADFEQLILKGSATLVPTPGAFGPCFTRRETSATVVNGAPRAAGFEWIRVPGVADSTCRAWGPALVPRSLSSRRPTVANTKQVGTFGGARIPYTAIVEEHLLAGPGGVPDASLVTIAYVRDDVKDRSRRPVTFVFNGGPGSSSSPLHMAGLGPRLTTGDSTIPNPSSILDATDLVFMDPIGTGFSRPFTTEAGRRSYWTRSGDAASVAQAIRRWLRIHGRERSPRYLAGESYGTVRANVMLHEQKELRFDGLILVAVVAGALSDSPSVDADLGYERALPTMATSAWFHGKGIRDARTVEEVFAQAAEFSVTDYHAALTKGARLDPAERDRVAARMSALIGVPTEYIISRTLRLSKDDWMLHVLTERGLRTGMLDTRVTSVRDTTKTGGLNDPSFNGGAMRFGTSMLAPALLPGEPTVPPTPAAPALEAYLKKDLRFRTLESYRSLNLDINVVWDQEGGGETTSALATAMRERPALRLFWTGGYFDLTTPAHAAVRAFEQAGIPAVRTTAALLPAAHSVFADDATRRILAAQLRTWIH